MNPKLFKLNRITDHSGISGCGIVAYGTLFPCGKSVICWNGSVNSITIYDTLEQLESIHGHGGKTLIEWI